VVAIGKAAGSMMAGAVGCLGDRLERGLVITKPGHGPTALPSCIEVRFGGHPMPDAHSLEAGDRLLGLLDQLAPGVPLLMLISGGASALVERLQPGLSLADLARANGWLLGSGLAIGEVNRVRKALSAIKGGGLWPWIGARPVTALLLSDVRGDDPRDIGSGLLFPDPRPLPQPLPEWLEPMLAPARTASPAIEEAGSDPATLHGVTPFDWRIVASLDNARAAAARKGAELGYHVQQHEPFVAGDAAQAGREIAQALRQASPGLHIWGGEPTVRLPDEPGRGGRAQQLALAAAIELAGCGGISLLAAGTDGSDGPGGDAGALVDGTTLARACADAASARAALQRADAGSLLGEAGDLLETGPTGTNVMDLFIGIVT
jgi:hydroxypyruvate reductase